jgi:hypothetical protein
MYECALHLNQKRNLVGRCQKSTSASTDEKIFTQYPTFEECESQCTLENALRAYYSSKLRKFYSDQKSWTGQHRLKELAQYGLAFPFEIKKTETVFNENDFIPAERHFWEDLVKILDAKSGYIHPFPESYLQEYFRRLIKVSAFRTNQEMRKVYETWMTK